MASLLPKPEYLFTDGTTLLINTLYCIGRNYREHAAEMNAELPKEPLVFIKPNTAYLPSGSMLSLPTFSALVHHEVELVVVIGEEAVDIPESSALNHIAGVAVGLDLTLRDLQETAKKKGEPWALAKGFRGSAPLSRVVPIAKIKDLTSLTVSLVQNGTLRQRGAAAEMERSIPSLISYLSRVFGLRRGDCIFTGTPKGVGPISRGDKLHAEIEGLVELDVHVS
jgi:2-keto-4-pentenoate hydratase/2-oxohepta-3-ene-1,7-dioic acid hydratase in catechol pathway